MNQKITSAELGLQRREIFDPNKLRLALPSTEVYHATPCQNQASKFKRDKSKAKIRMVEITLDVFVDHCLTKRQ